MTDFITGYFVRVERDGKWQSLDIAELRESEIRQLFAPMIDKDRVVNFVIALVQWIQEHHMGGVRR